jgi:hypothetical protein
MTRPSAAAPILALLAAPVPLQDVTPLMTGTVIALLVICIGAFIFWILKNYGDTTIR